MYRNIKAAFATHGNSEAVDRICEPGQHPIVSEGRKWPHEAMRVLAFLSAVVMLCTGSVSARADILDVLRSSDEHWLRIAEDPYRARPTNFINIDPNTDEPVSVQAGNVRVTGKYGDSMNVNIAVFVNGRKVATHEVTGPGAAVQIVRFDPNTPYPQVLILGESGGSGGFVDTSILNADESGQKWTEIEVENCCQGSTEKLLARDVLGTGKMYIIHYGKGDVIWPRGWSKVEAEYTAQYKVLGFENGAPTDKTKSREMRPIHAFHLKAWLEAFSGYLSYNKLNPNKPEVQVFALTYVMIKANLGEIAEAWETVVGPLGFSRNPKFLKEARTALQKNGYIDDESELPITKR